MAESKMAKLRMAIYKFFLKQIFGNKIHLGHKWIHLGHKLIFDLVYLKKDKTIQNTFNYKHRPAMQE